MQSDNVPGSHVSQGASVSGRKRRQTQTAVGVSGGVLDERVIDVGDRAATQRADRKSYRARGCYGGCHDVGDIGAAVNIQLQCCCVAEHQCGERRGGCACRARDDKVAGVQVDGAWSAVDTGHNVVGLHGSAVDVQRAGCSRHRVVNIDAEAQIAVHHLKGPGAEGSVGADGDGSHPDFRAGGRLETYVGSIRRDASRFEFQSTSRSAGAGSAAGGPADVHHVHGGGHKPAEQVEVAGARRRAGVAGAVADVKVGNQTRAASLEYHGRIRGMVCIIRVEHHGGTILLPRNDDVVGPEVVVQAQVNVVCRSLVLVAIADVYSRNAGGGCRLDVVSRLICRCDDIGLGKIEDATGTIDRVVHGACADRELADEGSEIIQSGHIKHGIAGLGAAVAHPDFDGVVGTGGTRIGDNQSRTLPAGNVYKLLHER